MYAHSANAQGRRHDLVEHLTSVARLASEFAEPFGGGELAYYLGLWHDIGKFDPRFQDYLLACETPQTAQRRGPDHKTAGEVLRRPPAACYGDCTFPGSVRVKFRVSHEILFITEVDAANQKEAAAIAVETPYEDWQRSVVTREDVVPIEESPINPHAGG